MRCLTFTVGIGLIMHAAAPAMAGQGTPQRVVVSCKLANGSHVALKAESHGADGDELFIEARGKTSRAFLDMPEDDFVGRIVLAKCVGSALIFALEYGPPYLKGVAVRDNPQSGMEERIYFSEKALPRWLYLGNREMMVVVPNVGYETKRKYMVYRYQSGKGQPDESSAMDTLPVPRRALVPVIGN